MATRTAKNRAVLGDFQTPLLLAREVARFVRHVCGQFPAVVEPTCGLGSFLLAASETCGPHVRCLGFDSNPAYVERARRAMDDHGCGADVQLECRNFYELDWRTFLRSLPAGALIIGNLPWVTNASMGALGGMNLPEKSNFQGHSGLAAKTGKANFDISEWMLIRLLDALQGTAATLAMLCKTATARKVLRHAWKNDLAIGGSTLHAIDAAKHFGVSVDACLLITHSGCDIPDRRATLYGDLSFDRPLRSFGIANGELVADPEAFEDLRLLDGTEHRKWRSGIKHDAVDVMEFRYTTDGYTNGLGETSNLEADYLYPLLKSSDIAHARTVPSRYVLVTQQRVNDDTSLIARIAPRTWRYLIQHGARLDRRRSSVYAKRSRFAVFGVGPYTFSPWKVAVSGMYKNLQFVAIGSHEGKPILLDDTCYFIPCDSGPEASFFATLLNSDAARKFLKCLVFFDSKRAVTIDVLRRLDLRKLAERLGQQRQAEEYLVAVS